MQIDKVVFHSGKNKKIREVFYVCVGTPYNEEHYYVHRGDIPLISSKTSDEGILTRVDQTRKIFDFEECLTWCVDGKAGSLFYRNYTFDSTHHSGILIPRKKKEVHLKWFLYTQQKNFLNSAIVEEGNMKLGKKHVEGIEIILPDYNIQKEIANEYEKLIELEVKLIAIENRLEKQLKKLITSQSLPIGRLQN